jgi:hypothetical protein
VAKWKSDGEATISFVWWEAAAKEIPSGPDSSVTWE